MKNKDILEYNTNQSLVEMNAKVARQILGLGMNLHVFHQIIGNFEDDIDLKTMMGNRPLGDNIAVKKIFACRLFSDKKTTDFYYNTDNEKNENFEDMMNGGSFTQRLSFFAMVGHILQMIRLRYPIIEFKESYSSTNHFEVDLIVPIQAKGQTEYHRIPLEFLTSEAIAQEKKSIKIICDTTNNFNYKTMKKINLLQSQSDDLIFAFYDLENKELPLYMTSFNGRSNNFKGESFFLSAIFKNILKRFAKDTSALDYDEIINSASCVYDESKRMFTLIDNTDNDISSLVKVNPTVAKYITNNINSNLFMDLNIKQYTLMKEAIINPTVSNLSIADEIAFAQNENLGLSSYLITTVNNILNSPSVQTHLALEEQAEKDKKQLANDSDTESEKEFTDEEMPVENKKVVNEQEPVKKENTTFNNENSSKKNESSTTVNKDEKEPIVKDDTQEQESDKGETVIEYQDSTVDDHSEDKAGKENDDNEEPSLEDVVYHEEEKDDEQHNDNEKQKSEDDLLFGDK